MEVFSDGSSVNVALQDLELTNLNWVSGAPVPIQHPVSPTRKGAALRNKGARKEEARPSLCGSAKSVKRSASDSMESQGKSSYDSQHCKGTALQYWPGEIIKDRAKDGKGSVSSESSSEDIRGKKPNCSYTSLIGLALMASEGGCLPVSEIYTYIE